MIDEDNELVGVMFGVIAVVIVLACFPFIAIAYYAKHLWPFGHDYMWLAEYKVDERGRTIQKQECRHCPRTKWTRVAELHQPG